MKPQKHNYFLIIILISLQFILLIYVKEVRSSEQAKSAMVVTSDPMATEIGIEVLKRGGNAIDAAVSIGFVMAVTYPQAGNLGGGGFMLIYTAQDQKVTALDYREKAPAKAFRDMFLDPSGNIARDKSQFSHWSSGVPGTVSGLATALEKHGTLSLKEILGPAIKLAEQGFPMSEDLANDINKYQDRLKKWPQTQKIFFKSDGTLFKAGDLFVQKDLAKTLKSISEIGIQAFYQGSIATLIENEMQNHNGLISKSDLKEYETIARNPIHGTYRGYDIYSMSPPSSGGIHIIQILNILEHINLKESDPPTRYHIMAEAMKKAYADRSKYLGDSDFVQIPIQGLTSKEYGHQLWNEINLNKASVDVLPGNPLPYESPQTTHYSVIDKDGNAVSNTTTINFTFGSGIVVEGAGFLLNNEMDDFSAKPGVPNAYGLIGAEANAISPHKRMLSSMSPSIILKDNKPFLITGSPGGSKIITTTLQIILNVIDHKMNIEEAVKAPRIHHQWRPNILSHEEGIQEETLLKLKELGHKLSLTESMGEASSILIQDGIYYGAADPRGHGKALGYQEDDQIRR